MPCQVQGRTLCAVLADGLEEVLPVCTAGVDYGTCMPSVRDDRLQFGLDRENDRTAGALVAGHLTFSAAGFCFAAGFVAFFAFAQRAATAFFTISDRCSWVSIAAGLSRLCDQVRQRLGPSSR
jgi:hypothetical protein